MAILKVFKPFSTELNWILSCAKCAGGLFFDISVDSCLFFSTPHVHWTVKRNRHKLIQNPGEFINTKFVALLKLNICGETGIG